MKRKHRVADYFDSLVKDERLMVVMSVHDPVSKKNYALASEADFVFIDYQHENKIIIRTKLIEVDLQKLINEPTTRDVPAR